MQEMPQKFYKFLWPNSCGSFKSSSILYDLDHPATATSGTPYHIFYDVDCHELRLLSRDEVQKNPELLKPFNEPSPANIEAVRSFLLSFATPPELSVDSIPDSSKPDESKIQVGGIYTDRDNRRYMLMGVAAVPRFTYVVLLDLESSLICLESWTRFCYGVSWDEETKKDYPIYMYTHTKGIQEKDEQAWAKWLDSFLNDDKAHLIWRDAEHTRIMDLTGRVNHPIHYGADTTYETIKVIEAWLGSDATQQFCLGNVLKYLSRLDKKDKSDGLIDLKKAQWYLTRLIKLREVQNGTPEPSENDVQPAQVRNGG